MVLAVSGTVHILLALQAMQATVTGTVRDAERGEPLRSAEVVLTDLDRAVYTDAAGRYLLRAVPAGPQHLSVRFIGYAERTLHALVPASGNLEIHFALRPEPIPLTPVSVRPRVPMRDATTDEESDDPERGVSIAAIRNHPLLAEPDALSALAGGEIVLAPESPGGVHIRGGAADQTAFVVDGIPVFNPYHSAGLFSGWNPDALAYVHVASAAPSPSLPDVLGGVIAAVTRTPGARLGVQGSISTTQARASADGPLGGAGAGYLLSVRSSYPGLIAPRDDASYLMGESGDALVKLEVPAFGGRILLLAYESEDELDAAATTAAADSRRHAFEWHSRSVGGAFVRPLKRARLRLQLWRAAADANAVWWRSAGAAALRAHREDDGALLVFEVTGAASATGAGLRAVRSWTSYRLAYDDGSLPLVLASSMPVVAGFVEHTRTVGGTARVKLATSLTAADGGIHWGPRGQLRWAPSQRLALTGNLARFHQFTQSARNAESIVGNIFPADLYVGARGTAVPVARSDIGVLSAEYRPSPGVRMGAQAYQRKSRGLLLVAPREEDPFATSSFTIGSSASRGFSIEVAASTSRYGLLGSYGWQRTRFDYADSTYIPAYAAAHVIDGGVIVFPTATFSLRIGAAAAFGRRATATHAGFEWESCNLLDRGCEFAGSPGLDTGALGATALPAYLRVDLGARKHWHLDVAGRSALVALFGTITNLFARQNVLNYTVDPATGERAAIEMRPWAPLVAGIDYRF